MISIKTKVNGITKYYKVFESLDELKQNGITRYNKGMIPEVKVGDWCLTDNGYIIPLLSMQIIRKGKYGDFMQLRFPNLIWNNMKYYDSHNWRQMPFVWSREPREQRRVFVTARQKLFALYLSQGFDIYAAFNLVFKPQKSRAKKEQLIKMILDNPNFIEYMRKTGLMSNMQETFKTEGASDAFLANKIKDILNQPTTRDNSNLQIKALEMLQDVLRDVVSTNDNSKEEEMNKMRDKFKVVQGNAS